MFKRLSNLIKGFFGMFVSGLEKKNPEALLEVEKETDGRFEASPRLS